MEERGKSEQYWKANRNLIAVLLAIWAAVSYGLAILLARPLDALAVGNLPMGFWWAQQGAMLVFVVLIFVYARRMGGLDQEHDVHEGSPRRPARGAHRGEGPRR